MRPFRDIPISQKLTIVVMVTATSALLLAGMGIVFADSALYRAGLERDLTGLARIISDTSTAALAFNDREAGSQILAALRARPHVIAACLYQPDGTMLAHYERSRSASASACPPPRRVDAFTRNSGNVTVSQTVLLEGRRIGTLMLLYDLDEIGERTRVYSAIVLGFVVVAGLLAFALASGLRSAITRPVSQLVTTTTAVSETSDYSIRAKKSSGDELGTLVDRFNEMLAGIESRDDTLTTALKDREEALREAEKSRERFRFMAESMPQKVFTATPAGDFDYVNHKFTEFTGLSFDQIRGGGWTRFIHPDDVADNVHAWRYSVSTGDPFHLQHRLRSASGEYRWHLSRADAMRDELGSISMWIGSDTDIHEQKEKEEELRRANEDLEQFAWSASHDLQEPVRNVAVFSELIAKRYRDRLDEDGQRFLGFLAEGGQRLGMLISDLLAYTRAGVLEGKVPLTDASAVLGKTLSLLSEAIGEAGAIITCDPLPAVYMGETHLQQVLQNLIGNALKYCEDRPARVHISAARQGAAWLLSVQDNGIGIDPQYHKKIFGVFKRLHRDERYSGTGIGLAICLRVVEKYGGRIWVESTQGQGATFYFTIPEREGVTAAATQTSGA